jgi:hypothetical protein
VFWLGRPTSPKGHHRDELKVPLSAVTNYGVDCRLLLRRSGMGSLVASHRSPRTVRVSQRRFPDSGSVPP